MDILNSKQVKEILKLLKHQWGFEGDFGSTDYVFLKRDDGKLFIVNKDVFGIDHSKIRINALGVYIAEIKGDDIRLSIEGSQLIGPKSNKNVVEVTDSQARSWLKGEDIELSGDSAGNAYSGFVIIKNNGDFLGSGRFRNNSVTNFVPKTRRLKVSD